MLRTIERNSPKIKESLNPDFIHIHAKILCSSLQFEILCYSLELDTLHSTAGRFSKVSRGLASLRNGIYDCQQTWYETILPSTAVMLRTGLRNIYLSSSRRRGHIFESRLCNASSHFCPSQIGQPLYYLLDLRFKPQPWAGHMPVSCQDHQHEYQLDKEGHTFYLSQSYFRFPSSTIWKQIGSKIQPKVSIHQKCLE